MHHPTDRIGHTTAFVTRGKGCRVCKGYETYVWSFSVHNFKYTGTDLEGVGVGPRCQDPPLKFEKCPFYLGLKKNLI